MTEATIFTRAAERRARIRQMLAARSQAEPLLEARAILALLADPRVSLRTVERDLKAIRRCRAASSCMRVMPVLSHNVG